MIIKDKKSSKYRVAILLATRGREGSLFRSLTSLINRCSDLSTVEFLLAFDNDDDIGLKQWEEVVQPMFEEKEINYKMVKFNRLGYKRLNDYYNTLAKFADSDWHIFWNDDALMESQGWDKDIYSHTGQFKLLAFHTHRLHPYSIFPIMPREWFDLMGHLSRHSLSDAWISQLAYMLNILERIPVYVTHDRHDLTGNNEDQTYKDREILEGNPNNPLDFHHPRYVKQRILDVKTIAEWLKEQGNDTSFPENVLAGKQDPWLKLQENDINGQMKVWRATIPD